jgi:hypothetical protein
MYLSFFKSFCFLDLSSSFEYSNQLCQRLFSCLQDTWVLFRLFLYVCWFALWTCVLILFIFLKLLFIVFYFLILNLLFVYFYCFYLFYSFYFIYLCMFILVIVFLIFFDYFIVLYSLIFQWKYFKLLIHLFLYILNLFQISDNSQHHHTLKKQKAPYRTIFATNSKPSKRFRKNPRHVQNVCQRVGNFF